MRAHGASDSVVQDGPKSSNSPTPPAHACRAGMATGPVLCPPASYEKAFAMRSFRLAVAVPSSGAVVAWHVQHCRPPCTHQLRYRTESISSRCGMSCRVVQSPLDADNGEIRGASLRINAQHWQSVPYRMRIAARAMLFHSNGSVIVHCHYSATSSIQRRRRCAWSERVQQTSVDVAPQDRKNGLPSLPSHIEDTPIPSLLDSICTLPIPFLDVVNHPTQSSSTLSLVPPSLPLLHTSFKRQSAPVETRRFRPRGFKIPHTARSISIKSAAQAAQAAPAQPLRKAR